MQHFLKQNSVATTLVFNVVSHHCVCYWFTEAETELVASAFCSCLFDCIESYCITENKLPIILFSDGCTYQNRNNIMSNALLNCVIKHNITIYQKFVEVNNKVLIINLYHFFHKSSACCCAP